MAPGGAMSEWGFRCCVYFNGRMLRRRTVIAVSQAVFLGAGTPQPERSVWDVRHARVAEAVGSEASLVREILRDQRPWVLFPHMWMGPNVLVVLRDKKDKSRKLLLSVQCRAGISSGWSDVFKSLHKKPYSKGEKQALEDAPPQQDALSE